MTPPCKRGGTDCPMRRVSCQSRCEKYQAFYRENLARYDEARKQRVIREVLDTGIKYRAKAKIKAV